MLHRKNYSLHKGKSLVKNMMTVSTGDCIVFTLDSYFAEYKSKGAAIEKNTTHNHKDILD